MALVQGGPTLASPAPVGSAISTVGSGVVRNICWRLRDAGAAAREMLVRAAMNAQGDGDRRPYQVSDGVIRHSSGASFSYGQVAAAAALLTPPTGSALVPDAQFKSIGQPLKRQDIPSKVDGSARYGLDMRLPGMLFAVVKHCPTFGGTLVATPRHAMRSAKSLKVSWQLPANAASMDSSRILADAMSLLQAAPPYVAGGANPPGTAYTVEASTASADAALTRPDVRRLDAVYTLPCVAHATMEVLNCTVDFVAGERCDVYAPTQSTRSALAITLALTGLPEAKVRIHTLVLGAKGDSQGYEAAQGLPYNFGARRTEWVSHTAQIPVGFWRPVGASINTFAVEAAINELAGQDAVACRRARLTDGRWLAALEAVASASGWGGALPAQHGTRRGHRRGLQHRGGDGGAGQWQQRQCLQAAEGLAGGRQLPDGEPAQRRGATHRRCGACHQRHALWRAGVRQRCGAAPQLQQQPHDPAERNAHRVGDADAAAGAGRPHGGHRRHR